MSFYIAIILFITSVIAGLIASIVGKNTTKEKFFLYAAVHGMFLFAFIASLILRKDPDAFNYFFLTYICSGLILSGLAWRSNTNIGLKIYFSIFIINHHLGNLYCIKSLYRNFSRWRTKFCICLL